MKRSTQKLLLAILTLVIGGIILSAFLLYRHSVKKPTLQPIQHYPHQHLSRNEYETGANVAEITYTLKVGDTLANVARLRYGHRNYSDVIKLYNHIEDERNIVSGKNLKLPNLIDILTEEGFTQVASAEAELILCARAKYEKVKDQLRGLRNGIGSERVIVPEDLKLALLEAADDLDEAVIKLKANKPGVTQIPKSLIGQLKQNAEGVRALADGYSDENNYDIDIVQQRYALALSYAIIWAREGFR